METSILPFVLSPSSLDRYRSCARRFLWQDVERLRVDEPPSTEQRVGVAVHRTLEVFFRHKPATRSAELLDRLLPSAWERSGTSESVSDSMADAAGLAQARQLLQTFAAAFELRTTPLRVEQTFELRLRNGTHIRTRVDRIDPWPAGVRLIDYKTGRTQLEGSDLARETASIVHLLAAERAGFRVERLSLFYLRTGEEVYWEPERDDLDFAADRLRHLLREVRDDREFRPSPSAGCRTCPFRTTCDAASG